MQGSTVVNKEEFACAVNRSIRICGSDRIVAREIGPQGP